MRKSDYDYEYIASLVIQSQRGSSNAFAELYVMTYDNVYNYACHYLHDTFLAQDIVQEIYIQALRKINDLKNPSVFIAWLNQIVFHVCYHTCQKNNSQYGLVSDEMLFSIYDEKTDRNPEAHAVQQDERSMLQQAVDELPATEKQIIIMKYYNQMTIDDIASALGISRSTVKRRLADTQKSLKKKLR